MGLLNEVVPHENLLDKAIEYAEKVNALPSSLVGMTKTLLRRAADSTWDETIELEEFIEPICFTTAFHQNAVRQFLRR